MSRVITGTELKAAFKKWNVPASYLSGFETRGRPSSLGWGDVKGIVIHHTASESQSDSYVNWLFKVGRSDLPAPLCHFATNKQGLTHVGALGRANHAGKGSSATLEKVKTEAYDGFNVELKGGYSVDGNRWFYGNEVMFGGVNGQDMTDAQYKAVVRFCAALCDFHGWTAKSVIGHREWSSSKIDPSYVKMYTLRRDVQALLDKGPSSVTTPPIVVEPTPPVIVVPTPPKEIDKLSAASYPPNGPSTGPHITWLGQRLVVHGYKGYVEGPGPEWGPADKAGVKWFQEKQGWTGTGADGYPGVETLKRLNAVPPAPVVTAPTETWFKLMSWNISNNNDYGVRTWGTRRSRVISGILDFNPDVICTQENTVNVGNLTGRDWIDRSLPNHRVVAGGDGRYIMAHTRVKKVAGGVFNLRPYYNGDDKQAAWAVLQIGTGNKFLVTSYHLENEGTSDYTRIAQMESCLSQAAAKAEQYGVVANRIFHAGDTNFRTSGAISTIERKGWVDAYHSAKTQVDKGVRSFNGWKRPYSGFRIDRLWVRGSRPIVKADQRVSLFTTADHNPQLFWIGQN